VSNKTLCEITEISRPAHSIITNLLRAQEYNSVVRLPSDQIIEVMDVDKLHPYRESIKHVGLWALRLEIKPSKDEEGDKTWIKIKNIWYRMLDIAGDQTVIGYKEEKELDDLLFKVVSYGLLSSQSCLKGLEILLCAIGDRAQQALQEAVIAEREFDSMQWDIDGYYISPQKPSN